MKERIIKIMPHHSYMYYRRNRNKSIEQPAYTPHMTEEVYKTLDMVINNPSQKVLITFSPDEFCLYCPKNKQSKIFESGFRPNVKCDFEKGFLKIEDTINPDLFGLADIIDKEPITSKEFLERINKNYTTIRILKYNLRSIIQIVLEYGAKKIFGKKRTNTFF